MHDPVCFDALGWSAFVEDQSFLHTDLPRASWGSDRFIGSGGFPITRSRGSVGPSTIGILAVSRAEEIPLVLTETCHS